VVDDDDRVRRRHTPGVSTTMTIVRLDTPPAVNGTTPSWRCTESFASLVRMAYLVSARPTGPRGRAGDAFPHASRRQPIATPLYVRTAVLRGCRSLGRQTRSMTGARRPDPVLTDKL
jgi:hypothetical protein